MSDSMWSALSISASGMKAQGERVRVISENVANSDTASLVPGGDPYKRQIISFKNTLDRANGNKLVAVDRIKNDEKTPFILKYQPDHPGADAAGYVKMPNVKSFIEMMDMREAQRSYEANLGMIDQTKGMMQATINLLQ